MALLLIEYSLGNRSYVLMCVEIDRAYILAAIYAAGCAARAGMHAEITT